MKILAKWHRNIVEMIDWIIVNIYLIYTTCKTVFYLHDQPHLICTMTPWGRYDFNFNFLKAAERAEANYLKAWS